MTNQIERLVMCFAVTDQFSIIPLKEVSRVEGDGFIEIETEICGEVKYQRHCDVHHEEYFKSLYLTKCGEVDKNTVFMSLGAAKEWASKAIKTAISVKENDIASLARKLKDLDT